ncbi:MAG: dihydropyrimidine dehydrogenase, partial [Gemmatimonadetes bacterium]|nr:dihydropyrimidine dehydrogenase [Gemmatimonadota bacterium]
MTHAPSAGVSLEERFAERLPALSHRQAAAEASRCLYCYDAPCVTACPTSIDVPSFIRMIGSGNRVGAARKILTRNPLGGTCARACPVEELCEGACVRATGGAPVAIGRLQRFATDVVGERPGGVLPRVLPAAADRRRGSVAIVGSGPAGLSAAIELARAGVRATVFESSAEPGGLCSHGIMPYRLPRGVVLAESEAARALGVEIRTGVTVGRDVTLRELADTHDALFLAIGLGAARPLGVPGEDLDGVLDALAFLRAVVTRPKDQVAIGRRVVVVGCGNTAMDTA